MNYFIIKYFERQWPFSSLSVSSDVISAGYLIHKPHQLLNHIAVVSIQIHCHIECLVQFMFAGALAFLLVVQTNAHSHGTKQQRRKNTSQMGFFAYEYYLLLCHSTNAIIQWISFNGFYLFHSQSYLLYAIETASLPMIQTFLYLFNFDVDLILMLLSGEVEKKPLYFLKSVTTFFLHSR